MEHENGSWKKNSVEKKLTPRQLINKRIQNKDYQITDEEITNLDVGADVSARSEKKKGKIKQQLSK